MLMEPGADLRLNRGHWNAIGQYSGRGVSAVAEVIGEGRIRISVRALVQELRNATVLVVLRSLADPADLWVTRRIKLDLNDGYQGHWSGTLQDDASKNVADAEMIVRIIANS